MRGAVFEVTVSTSLLLPKLVIMSRFSLSLSCFSLPDAFSQHVSMCVMHLRVHLVFLSVCAYGGQG